mmetsp:Transcript_72808/g.159017  ORF Transcript_72808/g.159017 Transcript_72808/m.159017 type:complete len:442 (-) Transcript_72808:104-1429(-)
MLSVSDTLLILSRYADLLGLLAILPILSELKFGALFRNEPVINDCRESKPAPEESSDNKENDAGAASAKAKSKASAKGKAKAKAKPAADDKKDPTEEAETSKEEGDEDIAAKRPNLLKKRTLPPFWTIFLLFLAEVLNSLPLLDPEDKQTRRAVGALLRAQDSGKTGLGDALLSLDKAFQDPDVYALLRCFATLAALATLLATLALGIDRHADIALGRPAAMVKQYIVQAWKGISASPALWALSLLALWTGVANRSTLERLAQKTAISTLAAPTATLLRSLGLVGAAVSLDDKGPLSLWATFASLAGAVRVAHFVTYERLSWETVTRSVTTDGIAANIRDARCMVALELWNLLALAPVIGKRRSNVFFLAILFLPCACLVYGHEASEPLEPYFMELAPRLSTVVAVLGICTIFLGGVTSMVCSVGLAQVLVAIHNLGTVKP